MAAPFYGDIESLRKLILPLIKTAAGADFQEQVTLYDDLVRPILESELMGMFTSWDAPDDTNRSIISTMWLYLVAHEFITTQFATNTMGTPSAYAGEMKEKYEKLMNDVKAGRMNIVGAVRHSAYPTNRACGNRKLTLGDGPDQPKVISGLFPKGLRK